MFSDEESWPFINGYIPAAPTCGCHSSSAILKLVPNIVICWTGLSSWYKGYSNKAMLHQGWSNRYKNYTVVITNWLTVDVCHVQRWMQYPSLINSFTHNITQDNFEDTKDIIKNRRTDNTMAKRKWTRGPTMIYNITQKTKDRATWSPLKPAMNAGNPIRWAAPAPHVASVVLLLLQTRW